MAGEGMNAGRSAANDLLSKGCPFGLPSFGGTSLRRVNVRPTGGYRRGLSLERPGHKRLVDGNRCHHQPRDPMKKFLLAPALAALAMFAWGFLFWGGPHHLPYKALALVPDEAAAGEALGEIFPATGTYLLPGTQLGPARQGELMQRGPIAEVHFVKSGRPMMDPIQLLKGYLHEFALCLLLVFMLDASAQTFHSAGWVTMQAFYDFVAFFIAGLVLGKILTPKRTTPAAPAAAASPA